MIFKNATKTKMSIIICFHALGRTVILHAVKEQDSDYRYECKAQSTDNSDSQTIGVLTKVGTYSEFISTRILFGGSDGLHTLYIILSCPFIQLYLLNDLLSRKGPGYGRWLFYSSEDSLEDLFWLLVNQFSQICGNGVSKLFDTFRKLFRFAKKIK